MEIYKSFPRNCYSELRFSRLHQQRMYLQFKAGPDYVLPHKVHNKGSDRENV